MFKPLLVTVAMASLTLSACSQAELSEQKNSLEPVKSSLEPINSSLEPINSSLELVQSSLEKAKQYADYHAIITLNEQGALAQAKEADKLSATGQINSVLQGKPFVVKDNIHVKGLPNTAGTPALRKFIPEHNNEVVQRLLNAGAVMVAKTNMHELAFGITSNNQGFGAVKNAHDKTRIAGGSSGGTAVAIALGIVDMGLGTDTGGSTRIPAVLNGIAGFRPSIDRYPGGEVTLLSSTRDTVGPMAKDVKTIAMMDAVITNDNEIQAVQLKGVRLGVPTNYFYDNIDEQTRKNTQAVLTKLKAAGVELVEVALPNLKQLNDKVSFPVVFNETMRLLPAYLKDNNTGVSFEQLIEQVAGADVKGALVSQLGEQKIPEQVYQDAIKIYRPQLQALYKKTFAENRLQALIFPATPLPAQPIASSDETVELNGQQVPTFPTYIQNTDPSSNAGIPSLVIPSGVVKGVLPVGIELDGPMGSDRKLLAIGMAIETLIKQ